MYDIIVDIDGTIADNSHRVHHINSKQKNIPKNWTLYLNEIKNDTTHDDIIFILTSLKDAGAKLVLCTGRNEDEREDTWRWLEKHNIMHLFDKLYMRAVNDYRSDDVIKLELLDQIRKDGYDPRIVFEDRTRVVNMWRKEGLRCLQVQPGDF